MLKRIADMPPVFKALLSQAIAYFLGLLVIHFLKLPISLPQLTLICGGLAGWLGYRAGLAIWWLPIQVLFVPALLLGMSLALPPWTYLAAFLALLMIYWSAFRTQVPLYLSSEKAWNALLPLLPEAVPNRQFQFIDLGCGVGGVLTHLAKARPDGMFHGVEYAPLPFAASWLRIKWSGLKNCNVRWGSLWKVDLGLYDVAYAYLSPVPMQDLWHKVHREMQRGTVFISNTFEVPGETPIQQVQVDDLHRSTLYIWRF